MNAGPGGLGGVFVHERHATAALPRFEGWWGHDKPRRFEMAPGFTPIRGAEGWQLIAGISASVSQFEAARAAAG